MSKKFGWATLGTAVIGVFLAISALVGGNQSASQTVQYVDNTPVEKTPLQSVLGAAGDIVTNIVTFSNGAKLGDTTQVWKSKTLEAGSNQVVLYTNRTGRDVIASYGEVSVKSTDTASSTTKVYIFATTTSSVGAWADFGTVALLKGSLINGMNFATSSTGSTTSSVNAAVLARGNGSVLIPDGANLIGYLQQNIDTINGCRGAVGLCEAATSTRRGFNPVFTVRLNY